MSYKKLAGKHKERLKDLKKDVEDANEYFQDNYKRYYEFMRFVFQTSLTEDDRNKLRLLGKPAIEFNVLEAYISRLRGEFAKQEPGISVRSSDGVPTNQLTPQFIEMLKVVEAHLREVFFDANNDALEYNLYSDLLAGGFSVCHVYTDYLNEMSFQQGIYVERVFDPTLCGFDPLARESHKGDGRYCFQIFPRTREEFIEEYGEEAAKDIKFQKSSAIDGFNWSYKNQEQEMVLVCQYYEKKPKRIKIVKLSNGKTTTKDKYELAIKEWDEAGILMVPPVVLSERWTTIETICRYDFCETCVLDYVETNYKYLPLVFFDGNSVMIRDTPNSSAYQMTRPFVYHARGIQRLKNFSGQTIGSEIENMMQHKLMASLESIPEDYKDAYTDLQNAQTLVYNAYYDGQPDQPLAPPTVIQRTMTPPIVQETFVGSDATTQAILGSYDALLGISGNQISGVAIQQGAMQSNAAAIPYLMGYIKGINRVAQIMIDLIPKYYVTPRSIPILKPDGKRSYQIINDPNNPDSIQLKYDSNDLHVKIEAGVNSAVQKQVALEQITSMVQASPTFAQFMNSSGLETLLDNMDIRGIEGLKEQATKFMEEMKQAQAQAAQQGDPMQKMMEAQIQVEAARVEVQKQKAESDAATATAKVAVEKQNADTKFMEAIAKIEMAEQDANLKEQELDAENARTAVESAIELTRSLNKERE